MAITTLEKPNYTMAEEAAARLLRGAAVSEPPVDVVAIARSQPVGVVFAKFDAARQNISGFYDFTENTIFVNKDEFPLRQTFTVAHELGHAILHQDWARSADYKVLMRDSTMDTSDPKEKEANAFAAALLTPRLLMDKYFSRLTPEQLSKLFAVSVPMIKYRLSFLYGIS